MEQTFRWTFLLQLSDNRWGDTFENRKYWHLPPHRFCDENKVDASLWDELIPFLKERRYNTLIIDLGDGLRYDTHPEISAPDAWSKEFLIEKLAVLRENGIEPVPMLNFSSRRCAWMRRYSRMVGSELFAAVCADLIGEVAALFGNRGLFHLGLDGETAADAMAQGVLSIRNPKIFWRDAAALFACCAENGMRPWIWADKFWEDPQGFAANVPKEVLVSNRYYEGYGSFPAGSAPAQQIAAFEALDALGYHQIPACSSSRFGFAADNPLQTLFHCKEKLSEALLEGYVTIPHAPTHRTDEFYLKNDAHTLFEARRQVYPESL